jgi:hypothetical protein
MIFPTWCWDRISGCSPAAGTDAAFEISQDTGTSGWQLKIEPYTKFPHNQK